MKTGIAQRRSDGKYEVLWTDEKIAGSVLGYKVIYVKFDGENVYQVSGGRGDV